ncbi:InlB B-repeat-containing protein [Peptoniphilus grossensis]|uniref:InlB B-repeat-containing protein n=1 Tax=Peptoniphilus grossensis TaxID=1465756 RepID=A0ABU7XA50_9FIRM
MKRKILTGFLALVLVLQAFIPSFAYALEEKPKDNKLITKKLESPDSNFITIGKLKGVGFSKGNPTASISVEEVEQKNNHKKEALGGLEIGDEIVPQALRSTKSPYIQGQQPADSEKPKYWANVQGKLTTVGIDGTTFDWNKVLGQGAKVKLLFTQTNGNVMTGVTYTLLVDKVGTYTWQGSDGKPTYLPLYDVDGNPYTYNVQIQRNFSENVQLIIQEINGTPGVSWRPEGDKQVATISFLNIEIQQVASTKFVSEWHTDLAETERPQIEGYFEADTDVDNDFNFPKNDTTRTILRSSFVENFVEDEDNGPWSFLSSELEKTPKTVEVKTDTAGLTFEEKNGVKTVTSGDHKFKYEFKYDVINGGKLTMTEVIPVTFDANGGKFENFTAPDTAKSIVKEVDYKEDLTDKAEDPTREGKTFKGWSTTADGKTPATDNDFKSITEKKTFYAIWENNDIKAKELTVSESFKDGTGYVNDFIPSLDTLKGQVKIKDANGDYQKLKAGDSLQILDDSGNPIADDDLKDKLYDKLKEDPSTEVSRNLTLKAKVNFADGTSQEIEIPIKVIKNIYEGTSTGGKPSYVPTDYVKVTVDPTDKAKEPQRTYYYVNPAAKVVIPGTNPTGKEDYKFIKWTIPGTPNPIEYKLADRHQFSGETTITAQYSKDVIPQEGNTKPEGVPDNFVKVTFVPTDKGTMEGAKIFWVNPAVEVTIPVNNPVGKTYYTFKEWKTGENADGAIYNPSTPTKFTDTNGTTITATYKESDNIIPYDPSVPDPMPRPEGYVRVTFAADPGLKLTESKAYYVKANAKDAEGNPITLGNAELVKPAYKEETGFKFKEWDKEDTLQIGTVDIVVTAKATKLDNVIPEKDGEGNPNTKPEGYKEVTFVVKIGDESKGSIEGVTKFYVNPTEYVTINPPATSANTGYEFGTWDKDATIPTVYDKDTTITGSFNGLKDIIPNKNPDGTENKKPDGYKTVTFVIDPATGGKIADKEVKVYYVNPAKEVTVPQPKTQADTGYEFEKWDKDTATAKKYDKDTTVKGNFKKLDDIIPSTDDEGNKNAKPEGYVTVTFDKGDHGELEGKTIYYVNPEADPVKTLANITKPEVKPETGYKFKSWNFADTKAIQSNITVIAQYTPIDDVIPKDKPTGEENDKPEGYITVTFEKGEHGELEGNTVFYINPNKAVVLEGKAPTIKPNTGYKFADWDTQIAKKIQYSDGDKITALYNEIGDVIPQEKTDGSDKPSGYLTVTFDKGDHGTLSGKTVYYVKPNTEVTVPAPTVTPATGYEFKDWDKALTQTFAKDTKITAQYAPLKNVIPGDQTKPDGYVTVTFKAENGSLAGTTRYYVKPNVEVNLKDKADVLTKNPDLGYTEVGGTWDPTLGPKTYTEDATYTFKFKKLDDIIPGDQTTERPKGYVKVEFRSDKNGSLDGNTIFYVNPNAKKTMSYITPLPTIKANKGYKVGSPNWHPDFTGDTSEIKEDRIYVANYEALGEAKITYIVRNPEMGSVSLGSEDLSEDQAIQGSTATAKPGYEFVKWINTKGDTVSDDAKFVPSEKQSATYIAVFRAKDPVTFTVNKVWSADIQDLPTMKFNLYRKVDGGQEEAVPGAEVKEITKTNTEATWTNLPKEDSQGKPYTYSVKETFKDQNDVKNDNWILGTMEDDGNGNKTITNKLKTVPGTGENPDEKVNRVGKLTITKKIESKVTQPKMEMFSSGFKKAPAAPMEFTFKVTDPYGNVVKVDGQDTFTLKANETKTLENLLYGEYTVEETDAKGLTPFVKVGDGDETQSKTGKVTLKTTDKEGTVAFTNKNVKPVENPNIIEVKATKVWENGPSTDHTAVVLKLSRQADGGQKEEVTDVTLDKSRDANDVNKFNYVWKDLPKINDKGEEYTYTVEEANVTDNKVTVNGNTYTVTQDGNTITNTYVVPQTEDLIATKQWVGVPDGTAKPEVKFQLQRTANGKTEVVGQAMDLTNNQANFGKQDKTDANGNVYVYSVKELGEDGNAFNHTNYTSEVNGLNVTNTYHAPEVKYTVTYKAGSSTATGTMAADTDVIGTYTVKANGFTNPGYTFKGWKLDNGTTVQPRATITVTANVTLTAQWEKTTTPPTPDPDKPNPDKPNPWDPNPWNPDYPKPWNPNYPDLPYIPRYPEIRYETIVQEKIVKVPVPIADNAYVKEVRYMQGFMGDFRPKDGLTRAEAAQILANALVEDGYKYNPNFKLPYKDIGEAWYTRAVKIVTEAKVFAGYDDGNFKPQDKITRNEWIATLKRFQELGDVSGNHMKLKDGHWAMAEIEAAYKEGWLKIYSDGLATYEGDKFIPREEVAAVSNKAFNRVLDKTYIVNNDKNLITYKDVKKDMWSYEDILCASNTFLYKKDLYRAHWIKEDNNQFNINTDGFEIVKAKFQRNPR